jgi:DNA-binding response OmpR family regulator
MVFERHGFTCLQAADAASAAQMAAHHSPECMVMDLNLPNEEDGLALIRSTTALPRGPVIVVLTGRAKRSVEASVLGSAKVRAIVEKGSPTAELIKTVRQVCE